MNQIKPHPIYSKDATVHVMTGATKEAAFSLALDRSRFQENLEARWRASGRSREDFRIAIKPNIMTAAKREADSPVYTDPGLVEALIARMRSWGFRRFAVVESRNVFDYSYRGRSVVAVAGMIGYSGAGYEIRDLTEEQEPFEYGSVLGVAGVGVAWRDADYRISFAKNKTHWQCLYTACIKNVYGCLPQWDKMHHYHGRGIEFYESAVLIADRLPVHFGLLDAWVSGDGLSGHVRDANPNRTRTIFASDNIFALDWVAGEKMGLDPSLNFVMQEALLRWGHIKIDRRGDLTPWEPWRNVRPFVVIALNWVEELYWLSRFLSRAMASDQDPRFRPVSRGQWFFGIFQSLTRLLERLLTRTSPSPRQLRRSA